MCAPSRTEAPGCIEGRFFWAAFLSSQTANCPKLPQIAPHPLHTPAPGALNSAKPSRLPFFSHAPRPGLAREAHPDLFSRAGRGGGVQEFGWAPGVELVQAGRRAGIGRQWTSRKLVPSRHGHKLKSPGRNGVWQRARCSGKLSRSLQVVFLCTFPWPSNRAQHPTPMSHRRYQGGCTKTQGSLRLRLCSLAACSALKPKVA